MRENSRVSQKLSEIAFWQLILHMHGFWPSSKQRALIDVPVCKPVKNFHKYLGKGFRWTTNAFLRIVYRRRGAYTKHAAQTGIGLIYMWSSQRYAFCVSSDKDYGLVANIPQNQRKTEISHSMPMSRNNYVLYVETVQKLRLWQSRDGVFSALTAGVGTWKRMVTRGKGREGWYGECWCLLV